MDLNKTLKETLREKLPHDIFEHVLEELECDNIRIMTVILPSNKYTEVYKKIEKIIFSNKDMWI